MSHIRAINRSNLTFRIHTFCRNVRLSDVDIYLYATDQQVIGGEAIDDESVHKTTVVVHISLIIPAKFTPPDAIASLTVELKSEETLGVSGPLSKHIGRTLISLPLLSVPFWIV